MDGKLAEAARNLILFERHDEDFLASLAEDSAGRGENPSTEKWRERLLEDLEHALNDQELLQRRIHNHNNRVVSMVTRSMGL